MTLRELAAREARCRREMDRVIQKVVSNRVATENWAEVELREIHHLYSALATADSPDSLEALKRGLFLTWFECAEPAYLTGIRNLDTSQGTRVDPQVANQPIIRARTRPARTVSVASPLCLSDDL